ncbi:hypothetical protein XA68_15856 [Ophiocordyceps unilateralis]|uniref:Uncharacterized protein n=1 Tax=Ophiocordyceps unilateralis TaxID=268505 RepID=A0A2A9P5Z3_OPHUN|nr:hypothetical protein XA68_15856 [Ophiocordyceps unilateralis]
MSRRTPSVGSTAHELSAVVVRFALSKQDLETQLESTSRSRRVRDQTEAHSVERVYIKPLLSRYPSSWGDSPQLGPSPNHVHRLNPIEQRAAYSKRARLGPTDEHVGGALVLVNRLFIFSAGRDWPL